MSSEVLIAVVTAVSVLGAAVIAAVPGIAALQRRTHGAVEAEGTATRDALDALGRALNIRIDDVRTDAEHIREDVSHVREWQAAHDAEHMLIGQRPNRGDST